MRKTVTKNTIIHNAYRLCLLKPPEIHSNSKDHHEIYLVVFDGVFLGVPAA